MNSLEAQIAAEVRRRNGMQPAREAAARSRLKFALAFAAVAVVSMSIGGAAVAIAYQNQNNERRDLLLSSHQQKLHLAADRLRLAQQELKLAQQRVAVGAERQESALEAQVKVTEAQAQIQLIDLQLAEIRLSSSEPMNSVTAPLIGGRDFVTERWRVELSIPQAALAVGQRNLQSAQRRFDAGIVDRLEIESAAAGLQEVQLSVNLIDRKLALRQQFLKGELDAIQAELRVLELEAQQRLTSLNNRIALVTKDVERVKLRVATGSATNVELATTELRLQKLQLDVMEVKLELLLVQKKIKG